MALSPRMLPRSPLVELVVPVRMLVVFVLTLQGIRDEGVRLGAISPGGRHAPMNCNAGIKRVVHEVVKERHCELRVCPRLERGTDQGRGIIVEIATGRELRENGRELKGRGEIANAGYRTPDPPRPTFYNTARSPRSSAEKMDAPTLMLRNHGITWVMRPAGVNKFMRGFALV